MRKRVSSASAFRRQQLFVGDARARVFDDERGWIHQRGGPRVFAADDDVRPHVGARD
jgi:hypothetical protein